MASNSASPTTHTSLVATNESVTNYINDDVALSILSKLPFKSLKRFECVRKSWSHLCEDSQFIDMFRKSFLTNPRSYDSDTSLLIDLNYESLYSLSGDNFENRVELNWPNPFSLETTNFDICGFGSVNGILCLDCFRDQRFVLWNPTIEKFKVIISPAAMPIAHAFEPLVDYGTQVNLHGFGYDHIADDYKLICHVATLPFFPDLHNEARQRSLLVELEHTSYKPFWEIYSLRSNSWRTLDVDMPNSDTDLVATSHGHLRLYMDGLCHWVCEYRERRQSFIKSAVSFDLNKETFTITHVPSNPTVQWTQLTVLRGSIALISLPQKTKMIHISILGEIGVEKSWIKLLAVEHPCVGFPIGVDIKGFIFFENENNEIVCFDSTTKTIKELGLKGKGKGFRSQVKVYKKSLHSFDRMNEYLIIFHVFLFKRHVNVVFQLKDTL